MARIDLNFEAYKHNLNYLVNLAGNIEKLMVVFKDNAYGHGLLQMAPLAAAVGVKSVVVRNNSEASLLDGLFENILILADYPNSISSNSYAANSLEALQFFPKSTKIHLKLDTGMNRNGIKEDELKKALICIQKNGLKLEACFSHFYSADELSADFYVQKERYKNFKELVKQELKKLNLPTPYFHSCNSSALLRQNENMFDDDFARVGVATYGYCDGFIKHELKPVLSLWANKISSREIEQGEKVGYGGVFESEKRLKISTYDLGYADGLFRSDGKKELYLKDGKPFLGKTSMDSFMTIGDDEEVCLFEDAMPFAKHFNTIVYEILVKLSPSIPRRVI
ncbi:MAG: alanine racemase [Sulfurospirillaceae bacterium]|jgi:alanine racemase|nr:alanine racemase [Sulfurospirillaceae bacterium]MCK9545633.1 alanine racemase [Sulfurospirillaceae bacterium]